MRVIIEGSTRHDASYGIVNLELASALRARGHDVALIPWDQDLTGANDSARDLGLEPFELARHPGDVHVRQSWPPSFERSRSTLTLVVQPFETGAVPAAWSGVERTIDAILVPSRHAKRCWLQGGTPSGRVHIVPNGVRLPEIDRPEAAPRGALELCYLGGGIPRKGLDVLLAALEALEDSELAACHLTLKEAGRDTYYKGLSVVDQLLAEHPRAASRTTLLTHSMSRVEVLSLLAGADLLVAPYRAEGFGMPILEAMALGVVPVVTRGGGASDFVDDSCSLQIAAAVTAQPSLQRSTFGPSKGLTWALEPETSSLVATLRSVLHGGVDLTPLAESAIERARAWTWDRAAEVLEETVARVENHLPPGDSDDLLIAKAMTSGAEAIGALIELGDLHGARDLAALTRGAEELAVRLAARTRSMPDLWAAAHHRAGIPLPRTVTSTRESSEGILATAVTATFLAPLLQGGTRILDVGSKGGAMLTELRSRGLEAVGIESDPVQVAALRACGFEVVEGALLVALRQLEPASFDGAFLGHVVEHLAPAELAELLRALARVLSPGAMLVIQTLNFELPAVRDQIFWLDPTRERPYPIGTLVSVLRENGFQADEAHAAALEEIAPFDCYLVARRRAVASAPQPQTAPLRIVPVPDPASGFARATDSLLEDLSEAGFHAVRGRYGSALPSATVWIHDLPLPWLSELPARCAPNVARTTWEVRGVPAAYARALQWYERIWVHSSFARDAFADAGIDPSRIAVWRPRLTRTFDLMARRQFRGERTPVGSILAVTNFEVRKNLGALVRSFARAREMTGVGTLTLKVRNITLSQLQAFVLEELGEHSSALASMTLLTADLSPAELDALYLESDVFCLPTRGEGFGMPFLEAMAAGCAIVAPAEGGHRDVVDSDQLLVPGEWMPVPETAGYFRGQWWYEVDEGQLVDALVEAMVATTRTRARQLAAIEQVASLQRESPPVGEIAWLRDRLGVRAEAH